MTGQLILTLSPSTTMTARAAGSHSLALHALVCVCVCLLVCVCASTTMLIARTEVISLVKQVLKRQGTVPIFASERITQIGVIVQPDHRVLR